MERDPLTAPPQRPHARRREFFGGGPDAAWRGRSSISTKTSSASVSQFAGITTRARRLGCTLTLVRGRRGAHRRRPPRALLAALGVAQLLQLGERVVDLVAALRLRQSLAEESDGRLRARERRELGKRQPNRRRGVVLPARQLGVCRLWSFGGFRRLTS